MILPTILWSTFFLALMIFGWMFLGYPLAMLIASHFWGRAVARAAITPTVTVIVCTFNESRTIARRITNLLASDYPEELLEIIVVDSASPDGTAAIVSSIIKDHPSRNIKLIQEERRRGKISAINLGLAAASGEIVVLTDAPTIFAQDTIKFIVQNFADPSVGAVTGNFVKYDLEGELAAQETEWIVFRFRKLLRRLEALLDSTTWLSGELTAFRRDVIPAIPSAVVIDDAYIAMAVRQQGLRVVVDERAVYTEKRPTNYSETITIKVKSIVGGVQEMVRFKKMLFNFRYCWYGLLILPARLLHFYLNPFVFLALVVSSSWLACLYLGAARIAVVLGILGFVVLLLSLYRRGVLLRPLIAFLLMEWIIVLGLWKYITGRYDAAWKQVSTTRL